VLEIVLVFLAVGVGITLAMRIDVAPHPPVPQSPAPEAPPAMAGPVAPPLAAGAETPAAD
jgi:hypothetical protein